MAPQGPSPRPDLTCYLATACWPARHPRRLLRGLLTGSPVPGTPERQGASCRSVGSIGMALPAFLVPDWRTGQQGLAARRQGCRADYSRRVGRPDRGWVREATPSRWPRDGTGTTRITVRLPPPPSNRVPSPRDWWSLPVARRPLQPRAAPVAADALWRAGWPSTRCPASTARGCRAHPPPHTVAARPLTLTAAHH